MSFPTITERFRTSQTGAPPTEQQKQAHKAVTDAVVGLAEAIDTLVPDGREKSLALTHLEDALMRAGRGIYNTKE